MARDIGKGLEERKEITYGIKERTEAKKKNREALNALLGRTQDAPVSEAELEKFELSKEQNERCLYCDSVLHPGYLADGHNELQVDHVLPWSRSYDNSFNNKTLCCIGCNQNKKRQTPYEWFGHDEARWTAYEARVRALRLKGLKKRNLLMVNFDEEMSGRFKNRNLVDTRYACRVVQEIIKQRYYGHLPKDKRHVFVRPGAITALVRKSWGLERIKKDEKGRRIGDRHHALDAAVIAAVTEGQLNRLTKLYQWQEEHGQKERIPCIPQPWDGFAAELADKVASVFVSRSESGRARGAGHKDTIRQVWADKEGVQGVYGRLTIDKKFDIKKLADIKDPACNKGVIEAIQKWHDAGRLTPYPQHPGTGHDIRKIRVKTDIKIDSGFRLDEQGEGRGGGHVQNGSMVRVDVFSRKEGKKQQERFYLVPIYTHQVMDATSFPTPPNRAVVAYANENEWEVMNEEFKFKFSIFPNTYLELVKSTGEVVEGYYRSMNRALGAIDVSPQYDREKTFNNTGAKTLRSFKKLHIDRLGNASEIEQETRTWHGKVCT